MAAVAVAADNVRIAEGDSVVDTGTWGNDGGGGGVSDEPDFYYQGTESQSRKISTSRIGRNYTHGTGTDMTATGRRHYLAKIQATNKDALLARATPALGTKIGSASGAYYEHYLYGNDNYPKKGGWMIVPISPNVTGYRDATAGSPTLTSVLYWSILANFSSTSKSENVMIDAIDIGAGLALTGGDGVDADGIMSDFADFDQGTADNSFGYCATDEFGKVFTLNGSIAIGENVSGTAVATVFSDTGRTLIWGNGLAETGYHKLRINLGNATTDVTLTRFTLDSSGKQNNDGDRGYTTTEDTRAILEVTGTSGVLLLDTCNISNFASVGLNAQCTVNSCTITNSGQVDAGSGADLSGSNILVSAVAADASALLWNVNLDPNGELDDMTFSKGTNAHHAVEFGTSSPTTITLTGWTTIGFNATDEQNDSTLYFADRGTDTTWTVNISGGSGNFSYKKARAGDTVNIVQDPVTVEVTVQDAATNLPIQNARVVVGASDGTGDLFYQVAVTITRSGSTATVTHTAHGLSTNDYVSFGGASLEAEYRGVFQITVTGVNTYTFTVTGTPTTPATSPLATEVLLFGLTDVNGQISISRTFTQDQPIKGYGRKTDSAPYFKTGNIGGNVGQTTGRFVTLQLVNDGSNI